MQRIRAADPTTRAVARDAVRRNVERLGRIGQVNLDDVLRELDDARKRLVSMLATGSEFTQDRARAMIREIDVEAERLRRSLRGPMSEGFRSALALGDDDFASQAREVVGDQPFGFSISTGVSSQLIDIATGRSADLVGQITELARSELNRIVRRAATSALAPEDVAQQIGAVLSEQGRPEGVFGNLATQIERVHRTETSALYETAGKARTVQIAATSPWVIQEVWVTIRDGRERADHADMNGATITVGENFNYGAGPVWSKVSYEEAQRQGGTLGLAVFGPHDAILPAKDAVNCRCSRGLRRGPRKGA